MVPHILIQVWIASHMKVGRGFTPLSKCTEVHVEARDFPQGDQGPVPRREGSFAPFTYFYDALPLCHVLRGEDGGPRPLPPHK